MIPEAAVEAAAKAIYGNHRASDWSVMERMTCESQARRALTAAAPYMQPVERVGPSPTKTLPCTQRHGHPDPAYMCMAPEGHA